MLLANLQPVDPTITGYTVRDLRFPTSLAAIGSDPMKWVHLSVELTAAPRARMPMGILCIRLILWAWRV